MIEKRTLVGLPAEQATAEALCERIKELHLIYSLSELAQEPAITVEQYLHAAVASLPEGWRYAEDACAAITFQGQTVATANYRATAWQQRRAILIEGEAVGEVVIGYLSPHGEAGDALFLAEEHALLAEVARQVGRFVQQARDQETLRHSESRYRGLFEHTPIAVFEQDFSAVKQRIEQLRSEGVRDFRAFFDDHPEEVTACIQQVRFLAWSKASLAMYGASSEEELQVGLERLVPAEAQRLFVDELVWIARGRAAFEWEGINATLGGRPFSVRLHWSAEPGYEQTLERVLVTIEDVTEVKRLQQQMIRSERLAAMGQVTAVLAHEVQNPLQAIHTNLELLSSGLLEPDEQEECLAICMSEVQRLREMTRNVLSMSRVQSEVFQVVWLPDVWQRTQHLLGEQLRSAGIDVTVDLPAGLPAVQGSAEQLGQVLINLTLNAVDSMSNGGQVRLTGLAHNHRLVLTFTNNGPPIPAEHLGRLFEPFFSTKPTGTGLGLFVSQVIVQQHGGDLTVANLPDDQGVRFTITLPAAAGTPGADTAETQPQPGLGARHE
jgi:PAS domain S-box-containing protein